MEEETKRDTRNTTCKEKGVESQEEKEKTFFVCEKEGEEKMQKIYTPNTREKAQQLISYYISKWEQSNSPVITKDTDLEPIVKAIYRLAAHRNMIEREAVQEYLNDFYLTEAPAEDGWYIED